MANRIETGLRIKGLSGDTNALYVMGNSFINGDVNITGNVNVIGTATTLNTQVVQTRDNRILLNYSGTNLTAIGGGIEILSAKTDGNNVSLTSDINGDWNSNTGFIISGRTSDTSANGLKVVNNSGTNTLQVRNDGYFNAGNGNLNSYDNGSNVFIGSTKYKPLKIGIDGTVDAITINHANQDTTISTPTTIGGTSRSTIGNSARVGISYDGTLGLNYIGFAYNGNNGDTIYGLGVENASYNQTIRLKHTPTQFGIPVTASTLDFNNGWSLGVGANTVGTHRMVVSDGLKLISTPYNTTSFDIQTTGGTPLFNIQNNGNVGIGTSTPSEKLHVSGNTKITGTLNIGTIGSGSPLINLGLDSSGNVVTGTTTTGGGGGIFTGGTISGPTNFTNGLTANTFNTTSLTLNGVVLTAITDTFVTGFTYNNTNKLTISQNQGKSNIDVFINTFSGLTINGNLVVTGSTSLQSLSATSVNTNSLTLNNVILTAITDTFVTGFTYNDNNRLTISRNQGQPDLNVFINTMSGLTVNGGVTATTMVLTPSPNASLIVRGTATTRGILPETDNTYSLGSTSQRWASMYTKEIRLYESKSGAAVDNDYISILAPSDLALTPNPAWSLVLPYSSGATFTLLGVYDGNAALNTSNTSWFTLSAGTNISLNQLAFSGGSVITINSTSSGGGTFTGGTVTGPTNFTGGLTANTLTVGTFFVGRKFSSSESFTGSVTKTVTHNLNTQDVIVQLWDSSNNLLNGATIVTNNVNSVDITVSSTATYKVVIIG